MTASADATARLWEIETGKPISERLEAVTSAAFSPDGKRIITSSHDSTARLWDAETGKPIGEIKGVNNAALSPDGTRIVTASDDGSVRLWKMFAETQELVSHTKAAIPRCLTAAQRNAFFLAPEPPLWCIELEKWPYHTAAWNSGLVTLLPVRTRRGPPHRHMIG